METKWYVFPLKNLENEKKEEKIKWIFNSPVEIQAEDPCLSLKQFQVSSIRYPHTTSTLPSSLEYKYKVCYNYNLL